MARRLHNDPVGVKETDWLLEKTMKTNYKKITALTLSFVLGMLFANKAFGQVDRQSQIQRIEQSIAQLQAELDEIKSSVPNNSFDVPAPNGSDTRNQFPPGFDSNQLAPAPVTEPVFPKVSDDDWLAPVDENEYLQIDPILTDPTLTESYPVVPDRSSTPLQSYVPPTVNNKPAITNEPSVVQVLPRQILPLQGNPIVIPSAPYRQPAFVPDRGGQYCPSTGRYLPPVGDYRRTTSGYRDGRQWDYFDEHFYGQRRPAYRSW